MSEDTAHSPTPILRQLRAVAPLLTERVASTGAEDALAALATARGPVTASLLADVLAMPVPQVGHLVTRVTNAGLVREQGGRLALTHPLIGATAVALVGPERMRLLHTAFARLLLDRFGDETGDEIDEGIGPAQTAIAEHRLAAGESGPTMLRACLRAAEWAWRQEDLQGTARWAESGLTMVPDERIKARLLHLHGLCAMRSGALATGLQDLRTAVEISGRSDDGATHAAITLDLLQARSLARVVDPDTVRLVRQALSRCPVTEPVLRARLVSHLTEAFSWRDPARHRRLTHAATGLARSSGDCEAMAFALLAGHLAPVPTQPAAQSPPRPHDTTRDLVRLTPVSATARTAARLARGHAALVTGDRSTVEELSRTDPPSRPGTSGSLASDWATAGSAHLQAALALLDSDGPRLSQATRHLAALVPQWAEMVSLVGAVMWPDLTGLPDPLVQRSPAAGQFPPWLAALRQAVVAVHRATHPAVRAEELTAVAATLPRPADLVQDVAWSTWLALIAHVAALLGDRDRCAEVSEILAPYASTFVVLGIGTPIGPAGWFLAHALVAAGRPDEAVDANLEAARISARLGSQPWVRRCRAQRLRLPGTGPRPVDAPRPGPDHVDDAQRLTSLQADDLRLLEWVSSGMTNRAIARRLSVSVPTVERRLSSIYRTLGVSNRAQAVSLLVRRPVAFIP